MPVDPQDSYLASATFRAELAKARMSTIDGLSTLGLRTLILINGGAIIALFTLIAQGAASPLVKHLHAEALIAAAGCFTAGLALALVAILAGFFAQQLALLVDMGIAEVMFAHLLGQTEVPLPDNKHIRTANILILTAAGLSALSLVAFGLGSFLALHAALQSAAVP